MLEVTPFGTGEARLMVTDPLPAGFEIDNPNLIRGGDIVGLDWTWGWKRTSRHSEFRQDRFLTAIDRHRMQRRSGWPISSAPSRPGTFHHPAASVEDMYRPDFRARSDAGRVTVTP